MRDLKIKKGFAENYKGEVITKGTDLIAGDCHCGFDCCYGFIKLPNYLSISGDTEDYAVYLVDGEWVKESQEDAKTNIAAFKANTLVSATGAVMVVCPDDVVELSGALPYQLEAAVLPPGALQTGTWSSSDELIATVDANGVVLGGDEGTATITFTSTDGGFTATCLITTG